MKNFTKVGMIGVLTIMLSFSLSVALAGNENATATKNMTNATTEKAMPQNCSDLRNCTENCTKIQNCSMYLSCIEDCTINATAGFGDTTGALIHVPYIPMPLRPPRITPENGLSPIIPEND